MPHIRIAIDEYDGQGAVYINGTKVVEQNPLEMAHVINALAENLGFDALVYEFSSEELEEVYEERDYKMPDQLHEFGELVEEEDRSLGKGLFSPGE